MERALFSEIPEMQAKKCTESHLEHAFALDHVFMNVLKHLHKRTSIQRQLQFPDSLILVAFPIVLLAKVTVFVASGCNCRLVTAAVLLLK